MVKAMNPEEGKPYNFIKKDQMYENKYSHISLYIL